MRLALSKLEYETRKINKKMQIFPYFLTYKDENKIAVIINFLETNIGKKRREINFKVLNEIFPSEKISEAILISSRRYFTFLQPNVKFESLNVETIEEFREFIFDFVSEHYQEGFVSKEERTSFLQKIKEEKNISEQDIENLLYADKEHEKILTKVIENDVDSKKLVEEYNYDLIETLLNFSLNVSINLSSLPGGFSKRIIFLSKANYVWSEILKTDDPDFPYSVKIEPPTEFFKGASTWGKNITSVALFIIKYCFLENIQFKLESVVKPRKRNLIFQLDSFNPPPLPFGKSDTFVAEGEQEKQLEVDSEIERIFLSQWQNNKGWTATAEPETIFLADKIFVPDFTLKRGEKKVYLEIVGFYTEKYIHKKRTKMLEIAKTDLPIIYLVDKKLESHFNDLLETIDVIYYKKNKIPSLTLHNLLESKYSDISERIETIITKFSGICELISSNNEVVEINQLADELGLYSVDNIKKIMEYEQIKEQIEKNNLVFVPEYGIITQTKYEDLKEFIKQRRKITLNELGNNFPELKNGLILICSFMGCKVNYSSLIDVEIVYQGN
ncbi:MAG: DUF790 family protein [Candidatus Heimdallarchaeaceae archaeon]